MSQANRLSSRRSEFVSIHQLVFELADAERRPAAEIAASLWNLLAESESPPEWLQHQDGVTYRIEPAGQETGWRVLEAFRKGESYRGGGWDHRMGFSLPALRTFFEASGLQMPPLGAPSDAEVLAKKRELERANIRNFLVRLAALYGMDKDRVRRVIARAEKAEKGGRPVDQLGQVFSGWMESSLSDATES